MRGGLPAQDWQIDYSYAPGRESQIPPGPCEHFSGWVEAFTTTNKRAHTVAQILLTEIIPRLGLPSSLQSDNGLEFTSKITQ